MRRFWGEFMEYAERIKKDLELLEKNLMEMKSIEFSRDEEAVIERAVKRLFRIKGRDPDKPVSICLADVREIPEFSRPSPRAMEIIERILPGPYTVVLEKNDRIPDILTAGSMKVGLRVPDEKVCTLLSAEFPVTSTSANISGKPQGASLDEIIRDIPDYLIK